MIFNIQIIYHIKNKLRYYLKYYHLFKFNKKKKKSIKPKKKKKKKKNLK